MLRLSTRTVREYVQRVLRANSYYAVTASAAKNNTVRGAAALARAQVFFREALIGTSYHAADGLFFPVLYKFRVHCFANRHSREVAKPDNCRPRIPRGVTNCLGNTGSKAQGGLSQTCHTKKGKIWNVLKRRRIELWRRGWDSNPRYGFPYARFRGEYFQPLSHLSAVVARLIVARVLSSGNPALLGKGLAAGSEEGLKDRGALGG